MAKRLLSMDYDKIVIGTFSLRGSDFYKYYQNIIDEFSSDNPDIYSELQVSLKRAKEEYNILLDSGHKLKVYLNDSFFDEQIELIKEISKYNEGRKVLDEARNRLNDIKNLIATSSKQRNKKTETFESIFNDKNHSEKILQIFADNDYLINGKWNFPGGTQKSLATPYNILQDYFGLIKNYTRTPRTKLRIWCKGLGFNPNNNELKNLLNNPANGKNPTQKFKQEQKEFFELFKYKFAPIKQLD